MDEPLTKSLERYDVLDRIAVGGMAEVFLAKAYGAHGFEKTLAIKRILPELARDPEFEARFIAEAKVAVRLSHANVVQVLDFGRIGESLFIAMEYVDGLDLAAMLRKFKDEKRLVPLPAAFHIAIEIIRALDFAHGHSVVHRDVSPSNVLVSRAGEVKIADFGIAVAAQPHRGGGPGPRKVMGKWRYMSPEQARGDTLDTRSDLFSAASVIFELFTGEKLFPGDESDEIIKNINEMPIPKMGSMRTGIPSRLDEVLASALARKPIDRPTRPATVLRSLIELSYESSIMATALDVAEALATVIPAKRPDGRGALDDVIRKQLHEQSVARRTAVTDGKPPSTETAAAKNEVSTGLFRKLDIDGVSRLEEVEATRVAAPRAKRNSSQGDVMPGDTDLHALYESGQDRDRFTEVGGPPTGQVPKLGQSGDKLPALKRRAVTAKGTTGKVPWLAIILIGLVAGGLVVFTLGRGGGTPVAVVPEAGVQQLVEGKLRIDPEPEGLSGYIERVGAPASRQAIPKLTRAVRYEISLPPNESYHLHLELAGYSPLDETVTAAPGEIVVYKARLVPALAKLDVATVPDGVQVVLAGRVLGDAPKVFENLQPAKDVQLTLQKPDFAPITKTITLRAGETTAIKETLVAVEKFGTISVVVTGAAIVGTVYFNGKLLGINKTLREDRRFRVPVGPGVILVKQGDKQATLRVTVTEGHREYTVKL